MVLDKTIGITGATGLLGRHLVKLLLKNNYKIIAVGRRNPKIKHKNFKWKFLDLKNKIKNDELNNIFIDVDIIVHTATQGSNIKIDKFSKNIFKVNINSSMSIAKWSLNRKKHFVIISGAAVYKYDKKNLESSPLLHKSNHQYIDSKINVEKKIKNLFKKNKFYLTIFRPSSIYGFGLGEKKIISKFIKKLKKGKKIIVKENMNSFVNLIHAKDVSNAILLSIKKKKFGVFNLGNLNCIDLFSIALTIKKILKSRSMVICKEEKYNKKIATSLDVNINKAKKILRWKPKINLHEGLKMLVEKKCY